MMHKYKYEGFNIGVFGVESNKYNIELAKSYGANSVRYPFIDLSIGSVSSHQYQEWIIFKIEELKKTLPYAEANNIDIILDLHSGPGGRNNRNLDMCIHNNYWRDILIWTWAKISDAFKDEPRVVMYDLFNEPFARQRRWRKTITMILRMLRKRGDNKLCSVSSLYGNPDFLRKFRRLLRDDNVIYTAHLYVPHMLTHEYIEDNNIGDSRLTPNQESKMRDVALKLRRWQIKRKARVYIGEFGCTRWSGYPHQENRVRWFEIMFDIINSYGWDYSVHALRGCSAWDIEAPFEPISSKNEICKQPIQYSSDEKVAELVKCKMTFC